MDWTVTIILRARGENPLISLHLGLWPNFPMRVSPFLSLDSLQAQEYTFHNKPIKILINKQCGTFGFLLFKIQHFYNREHQVGEDFQELGALVVKEAGSLGWNRAI